MSSSRNWSYNTFESALEELTPHMKPMWINHLKIIPEGYSEWSDSISVIVEFGVNREGEELLNSWNFVTKDELFRRMSEYFNRYVRNFLNTNITIREFRTKM
jgi:hypothetical protein